MLNKDKNTEGHLIIAIANGDEKAFENLYKIYYKKLYKFILKANEYNDQTTKDILQEAFLRVWLNRDKLLEIENFQAWIFKVVSTEALTLIKKELHIKTKAERLKTSLESTAPVFSQQKNVELGEIKTIVNRTISKLPQQRQHIYILSREEGLSPQEIADKLNISINTVYNTLASALKTIREDLRLAGYGSLLTILAILNIF